MSDLLIITGREKVGGNVHDEQCLVLSGEERMQLQDQMRKVCLSEIQIELWTITRKHNQRLHDTTLIFYNISWSR